MDNELIEKYINLYDLYKDCPHVQLQSAEDRGGYLSISFDNQIESPQKNKYVANGFISKFCF